MMDQPANDADNVVDFNGITRLPSDPDRVLKKAIGNVETAVIIGYDKEGNEYFATSEPDGPAVLWLLERIKLRLLTVMTDTEIS